MRDSVLHIVFSETVARSLSPALRAAGRDDRIVHLADDLSFGPINPPDPAARRDWIRRELALGIDEADWPVRPIDYFWEAALSGAARRVAWVSKRAAHEYAGFLEFVWRLDDTPCDVVEFDQDQITYLVDGRTERSLVLCLSELTPRHFEDQRYWERAAPLDEAARARYRANWAVAARRKRPAPHPRQDSLISAPITYFDDLLVSYTVDRWRKVARVIGEALVSFCDGPARPSSPIYRIESGRSSKWRRDQAVLV